jgi:hypothetical protein
MSEQLSIQPTPELQSTAAETAFQENLHEFAHIIPEMSEKKLQIAQEGRWLIDRLDVPSEFFEDKARGLVFSSIASRYAESRTIEGKEAQKKEDEFLATAAVALVSNFKKPNNEKVQAEDAHKLAVYDKYTDNKLSQEIAEAINNGLLSDVQERMGITEENEDPYEVRVLTLDNEDGSNSYGLVAPIVEWDENKSFEENRQAMNENDIERSLIREQQQGLTERGKDFNSELGEDEGLQLAQAWVTKLNGKTLLCISMPLAEKLLDPALTDNAKFYTEDERARDMALLEHEYVHTQGGMNLDGELAFGIGAEELRAEHFSGNKHGYMDIKGFFTDLSLVTGFDMREVFNEMPKGGEAYYSYAFLARELGLNSMLEIMSIAPRNYCEDPDKPQTRMNQYLGGFDGVTERVLRRRMEEGHTEVIEQRINENAKKIQDIAGNNAEWMLNYRKYQGLHFLSDMMLDRIRHQKKYPHQSGEDIT